MHGKLKKTVIKFTFNLKKSRIHKTAEICLLTIAISKKFQL